jgi:hypothetical protein
MFIVENSCACDSQMTCSVTPRGGVLDLHIGMTRELCNDCGRFAATCNVPRGGAGRTYRVTIGGKPVLDALELPRTDAVPERCYE